MNNHVSASSAKDNSITITELTDPEFMTEEQYDELVAAHSRKERRLQAVTESPLRITRFGAFILGLLTGMILLLSASLFIAAGRTIVVL